MNATATRPRGALSALSDESVLAALQLARTGKRYDLGVDLGNDLPRLAPDSVVGFNLSQYRTPESFAADAAMLGNSFSVEVVHGSLHQSSHIDALIHAQRHGRVFGGEAVRPLLGDFGWQAHGAETIPPIIMRGVVLDAAAVVGVTPVPDRQAVTVEQLQAAAQDVALRPGDAVLVRTGKVRQYATDRKAFEAGCPGISGAAARWLAGQGMALFGLDATSADPLPGPDWDDTAHEALLIQRGIHIVENLWLEDLVADGVREFTFICLPLRIRGGTGSWVRPLALA
ncbi:MAG: cyclase family protein [Anaerolineales bacterium]|nr:cyclase family protein [Anaerolineales bacterium]